jgi:hypothetical protein
VHEKNNPQDKIANKEEENPIIEENSYSDFWIFVLSLAKPAVLCTLIRESSFLGFWKEVSVVANDK